MNPPAPFDLHAAESASQVAAIWLVLKTLMRDRLMDFAPEKRVDYLDGLLKAAETITLPTIDDPEFRSANEWIVHRYWQLITEFVEQISEHSGQNGEAQH